MAEQDLPPYGDLLRTLVIRSGAVNDDALDRAHIARPSYYLLRPDGHVGLAGTRFDAAAVSRYLAERHLRVDTPSTAAAAGLTLRPV